MNNVLINPLMSFFNMIHSAVTAIGVHNLSLAYFLDIFIFTLIVRCILLPLTVRQTISTVKTQELQPKVKALQEKYKNDPKLLQQKQMELYKESGVNPLAGCLPVFLQLPIFMAMYYVIYHFKGFDAVGFLWVKSLGKPDTFPYILPIISGLSSFFSMRMVQPKGDDPSLKTQKQMNYFMAAFSFYIGIKFKSALVLYWIIGNAIQMLQQYFIIGRVRRKEEEKLKANVNASENNSKSNTKSKPKLEK